MCLSAWYQKEPTTKDSLNHTQKSKDNQKIKGIVQIEWIDKEQKFNSWRTSGGTCSLSKKNTMNRDNEKSRDT